MAKVLDGKVFDSIQEKMLGILSDGMPHDVFELHRCLRDPLSKVATVAVHLSGMRKSLRQRSQDILTVLFNGAVHYQHVILLEHPRAKEILKDGRS